jgi:eukaryotic-like serine/threonine-protein kinase
MTEPSFARIKVGQEIAGKYRVEHVLGVGGMGIVVAARHLELDELRAIKLLHPAELGNAQAVARFACEARAASGLHSEHIARVFDAGRLEDGVPYFVLEHLEGCDLLKLSKSRGPLPLVEAALYIVQACDAVAEAHAAGVIHRDLKPANLFLTHRTDGSPCVKVLDFGIAKRIGGRCSSGMTRTTDVMGSPLYMSPEQMRSTRDVDGRTDVWALGAILYKLLTGVSPFEACNVAELYSSILERDPSPLSTYRPDIPEAVEKIIARCLRKDREERPECVLDLAAALAPFIPEEDAPRSVRNRLSSRPTKPITAPPPEVARGRATPLPALPPIAQPLPAALMMRMPDESPTVVPDRHASVPGALLVPPDDRVALAWGRTGVDRRGPRKLVPRVTAGIMVLLAGLGAMGFAMPPRDADWAAKGHASHVISEKVTALAAPQARASLDPVAPSAAPRPVHATPATTTRARPRPPSGAPKSSPQRADASVRTLARNINAPIMSSSALVRRDHPSAR